MYHRMLVGIFDSFEGYLIDIKTAIILKPAAINIEPRTGLYFAESNFFINVVIKHEVHNAASTPIHTHR